MNGYAAAGEGTPVIQKLRPRQVRTRLTLWYVFVLASVLAACWFLTASFFFFQLRSQLGHYASHDIEDVEGLLYFEPGGKLTLHQDYHKHPESERPLERLVEVRSPDGEVLYRNKQLGNRALGGIPRADEGVEQYSARWEHLSDGTPVQVVSRRWTLQGHPLLIRLAFSEVPIWAQVSRLNLSWLLVLPIALALAGLGGYLLAARALAPLGAMARRAERITSESLHDRLPNGDDQDELGHLARVFNNLLARLEQTFDLLRRFTSDASHELRTPLTSMRSVGEVALQTDGNSETYREAIGSMLEEVNRLTALIDSLLTISRADAGTIRLQRTVFSAIDLAHEAAGLIEVLVEEKGQTIIVEGDELASLNGDRVLLTQALVNIIHNAVKYSPAGETIRVGVCSESAGTVCIEVQDHGPGIAPEHSAKIFDRFYRIDDSRSRQGGGVGLGLAIAQWAVRVHGGDIQLSSTLGSGSVFRICLPPAKTSTPPA
ncbi:MAG: ATP-binding protein [Bryobacteraceae bacterium]|nr:ATP-binding protein [Bryobacteraceae bacterium]